MLKYLQYTFAYISIIIFYLLCIVVLLSILGLFGIKSNPSIILYGAMTNFIYEKYKPMDFKDLIKLVLKKWP